MEETQTNEDEDFLPSVSNFHQKSSEAEPSCASIKTDASMDQPMKFKTEKTQPTLNHAHQKNSEAEPSCVSMKSDASMDQPMKFKNGDTQPWSSVVHQKISKRELHVKSDMSMIQATYVQNEDTQPCASYEVLNTLRSNLLKKFQCLLEGTRKNGNPTYLDEIYTELYITESKLGDINNEHEVRQIETQSRRIATEDTPIQCKDIFRLLPGQDKVIKTVMTKGVAGIGKTVSVQKFILDWAEGKENQEIQLIIPLPFRELNLLKDMKLSLSDLLCVFLHETKDIVISDNEYKVLFIFDGLDECRLTLDFRNHDRLFNIKESNSVDMLVTNLIVGNLLPSALIWITSRPAIADLIPSESVHRVTEVRGFSGSQKEEYFRKRVKDESLADRIISHLKSSRSLYIMCHIPVFCWISATVLEKMFCEAKRAEIPKTLTQMYTHYLVIQTNIKHEKDYEKRVKDENLILKLGKVAFQNLVKGNLIFYEEDLRECGIDVTEASLYSGLCTQIFREELGLCQGKLFCFVHLSVQEHLAALYAHLSFTIKKINVFDQIKQRVFTKVINSMSSLSKLHHRALDETLQSKNGHLDLFLRFLLGLSVDSNQTVLQELLPQTGRFSYKKKKTIQQIKQKITESTSPERSINLFHCLNELGDESLMKEIQAYLKYGGIREIKLSSSQWSALVYVLLTSDQKMDDFNLKSFIGRQHTADEVLQKLITVIKESTSAQLQCCELTAQSFESLSSILQSSNVLRELDLSNSKLPDSGLDLLFEGLKSPSCKLEILRFSSCNLTNQFCGSLSSVFHSSSSVLRELDLSDNSLQNLGVKLLAEGLKSPNCHLEVLRLSGCMVTEEGCGYLSSALSSNSTHMRELDLSYNHPGDSGVKLLSKKVEDPNCSLEKLNVDHGSECRITEGPQKWLCFLTLDPNTANNLLSLNDMNRSVTNMNAFQSYPDHPERFDWFYPQVMCRESVSGRCYWEAEWDGDGVFISVSYNTIQRKGWAIEFVFGANDHSWSLWCRPNGYSFYHKNVETHLYGYPISHRIGVYVDHCAGILNFYNIGHATRLIHTVQTKFSQPLYPGFYVSVGASVKLCS